MLMSANILSSILKQVQGPAAHPISGPVALRFSPDGIKCYGNENVRIVGIEYAWQDETFDCEPFSLNISDMKTFIAGVNRFTGSNIEPSFDPTTRMINIKSGKKVFKVAQVDESYVNSTTSTGITQPPCVFTLSAAEMAELNNDIRSIQGIDLVISGQGSEVKFVLKSDKNYTELENSYTVAETGIPAFSVRFKTPFTAITLSDGPVEFKTETDKASRANYTTRDGIKVQHVFAPII